MLRPMKSHRPFRFNEKFSEMSEPNHSYHTPAVGEVVGHQWGPDGFFDLVFDGKEVVRRPARESEAGSRKRAAPSASPSRKAGQRKPSLE